MAVYLLYIYGTITISFDLNTDEKYITSVILCIKKKREEIY